LNPASFPFAEDNHRSPQREARVRRILAKYPELADASKKGITTWRIILVWCDESKLFAGFMSEFLKRYSGEIDRLTPIDTIARDFRDVLKKETESTAI
jgi:hypothetical protein